MQNIFIVSGSHRKNSQSGRMARYLEQRLKELGAAVDCLDLAKTPLPFWREDFWDNPRTGWDEWEDIAGRLQKADGLVVISPEWHGMVPSGLKNFFLLATSRELADKPGLIVAVSSGMGGSYPVSELRISSTKNNRLCYLPDHLIIRDVENVFLDPQNPSEADEYLAARITHDLKLLLAYAKALGAVRAANLRDWANFPNGM
jgi:NAD(P)H-dependent FMN reductase